MNLSLLAKWKWRLLQVEQTLWKTVLVENYGDHVNGLAPCAGARWPRFTSLWWKNLMNLEVGVGTNWFSSRVRRRVGNGRNTCFWKDKWLGEEPLLTLFSRHYSLSTQKEAKVGDLMVYQGGMRVWNTTWRRHPFVWEVNLIDNLMALLKGVILGPEEDRWEWIPDDTGVFSVKSAYTVLELISILVDDLCPLEEVFFPCYGKVRRRLKWWRSLGLCFLTAFLLDQTSQFAIYCLRIHPFYVYFAKEGWKRLLIFFYIAK